MELLVPGNGVVAQDADQRELLLPGGSTLAEDQQLGVLTVGLARRAYQGLSGRNPYLFHRATDEGNGPAPPADVPDGGTGILVVPVWDGFRLARAGRFYYQSRNDRDIAPEPPTLAPHLVRLSFKAFRPNRYILSTRRDDTIPPEPPGGPPHPPRGRPFRRDGNLGYEEGTRYRRNRYIWNSSVEGPLFVAAVETYAPFFVRLRFTAYRAQNRHVFHYYYAQPIAPPPSFRAGWADESTITINMRRIDRGVIA